MSVTPLTEHHLESLSLKVGCTGCSESTLVKMPQCWKSRVTAHYYLKTMFVHTREKPNSCEACGKCFTHSSYLKRHMRIHTGQRSFTCDHCKYRILHECSCFIEFIKRVGVKRYARLAEHFISFLQRV